MLVVTETVKDTNNRVDLMFMMARLVIRVPLLMNRCYGVYAANANAPFATNIISHNRVLRLGRFRARFLHRYHPEFRHARERSPSISRISEMYQDLYPPDLIGPIFSIDRSLAGFSIIRHYRSCKHQLRVNA